MIAQRFRSVGWVAGVAFAAILLYIISLQVATERGRLEAIDRKIAMTKRDIRQLQTEMGTRASLRQLERWNGDVLALSSPGASQYLSGEDDISKIDRSNFGVANAPPPPMMAAVMVKEPAPQTTGAQVSESLLSPEAKPEAKLALTDQDRQVQQALGSQKPQSLKPTALAETQSTIGRRQSLGEIAKQARAEARSGGSAKP
jgi:hypothetical protein